MELRIYEAAGSVLVKIRGRIILDECDRLKNSIVPLINPQVKEIHLDLSNVEFIDSAGLGVLVGIKVSSNKHRARLALLSPSRGVSDILMVSKLDSIFEIVNGTDADRVVGELEKPSNERPIPGASPQGAGRSGAPLPSMPAASPAGAAPQAPGEGGSLKERLDRLCKEAVEFMRRGDYENAANAYRQAIDIAPDYLPAHNNLAIVYEKRPHWHQQAIEAWNNVLDLSVRNNDAKHIDRARKHLDNLQKLGSG